MSLVPDPPWCLLWGFCIASDKHGVGIKPIVPRDADLGLPPPLDAPHSGLVPPGIVAAPLNGLTSLEPPDSAGDEKESDGAPPLYPDACLPLDRARGPPFRGRLAPVREFQVIRPRRRTPAIRGRTVDAAARLLGNAGRARVFTLSFHWNGNMASALSVLLRRVHRETDLWPLSVS
ncbi:hypothetical protein DL769_006508 [Monosporascus sp. CRB-8-3]|nr:hypothetical protein DL769_006508 [Monosporascus sp. CRB-8-3]